MLIAGGLALASVAIVAHPWISELIHRLFADGGCCHEWLRAGVHVCQKYNTHHHRRPPTENAEKHAGLARRQPRLPPQKNVGLATRECRKTSFRLPRMLVFGHFLGVATSAHRGMPC